MIGRRVYRREWRGCMAHVLHKEEVGIILWVQKRRTRIHWHWSADLQYRERTERRFIIRFKSGIVNHSADAYKKMDDGKLCWDY